MRIPDLDRIISNPLSHKLSFSYDRYDNVEGIHINLIEGTYHVLATINVQGRIAHCTFEFDSRSLHRYYCDCQYCNDNSACAHIGCVLLKLETLDIKAFPYYYDYNSNKQEREAQAHLKMLQYKASDDYRFLDNQKQAYQANISSIIQNKLYELEPTLELERESLYLSYKVGLEKKYVVKNIGRFLDAVNNEELLSYGKSLSFIHKKEWFNEFSNDQILFLDKAQTILEKQKYSSYSYRSETLGRKIYLTSSILDLFFDTYYESENETFDLVVIDKKIKMTLTEENDIYILSINEEQSYNLGDKYIYIIEEELDRVVIQRIQSDNRKMLYELVIYLARTNSYVLMKQDYREFYKYILSPVLDYIDLETNIGVTNNTYDTIHLFGDVNEEDKIVIRLEYINDTDNHQNGFDETFITNYQQDIIETYIKNHASNIDYKQHVAYLDINSEKSYEFIKDGFPFLKEYCEIFVSSALKKVGESAHYSISVGVRVESNLLKLEFDSIQIPKEEIFHVLEQYRRKKKFYRLKNGELLYLDSPQLEEVEELINQYHIDPKKIKNGVIELDSYRIFSLDEDANTSKYITIDRADSFNETLQHFKEVEIQDFPLPLSYAAVLRDYQKKGYIWLKTLKEFNFNGILADDMGLGKTLQVIALIESLETNLPSIVICPSSLIYNWEDEVHKFSKNLKVGCVVGDQTARKNTLAHALEYNLLVTSYDYIRRDVPIYEDMQFEYVILDEAQYIKNQKTKNAISVKALQANHKLALTGTPIENSLAELWSIFDFLMPNYLFNYHYFQHNYESAIVKENNQEVVSKLRKLVTPFILRRNKKDVLKELPDKIEKTQYIQFTEEENKIYLATLAQVNKELQALLEMEHINKMQVLAILTRLRQICCEPRLLYDNIGTSSSKLNSCMELISRLKENNQKALLFSSFTSMLDLIAKELSSIGISYFMLTGNTSKEERRELVEYFQNDDTMVFLISLKAGGTGLNLTAAQAVIHYDPWWNVSAQMQATDRAHRIGQKNSVQVFKLVMKNSIEEKILDLQSKKKELADAFIENNEGSISRMSKEDIIELFSTNNNQNL